MSLLNNKLFQWSVYALTAIAFYIPAYRYGMVTDFLSWIYKYQSGSFSDIPFSFGYQGLHPVFHFFNYSFFLVFGLNKLAWSLLFALLHGTNAFLLRMCVHRTLKNFSAAYATPIAVFSSLVFLVSPYQVEVVTWKACMHYLLATGFLLTSFYYLLKHFSKPGTKKCIYLHHLFFVLSLFTLEISLAAPFIFFCYFLFQSMYSIAPLKRHLLYFTLPQIIILVLYFFLNKLIIGDWVGHYGSELHLEVSPLIFVENGFRYFFKYLLLSHFWDYEWRDALYGLIDSKAASISLLSIGAFSAILILKKFRNRSKLLIYSTANVLMFFMALVPIASLYFMYLVPYQNDRYAYLASVFFYPALISLIYLFNKPMKNILIPGYLLIHFFLGWSSINECRNAAKILDGLIYSFEACNEETVILLGLPDNYRGKYLYRDLDNDQALTFKESLDLFSDKECDSVQIIDAFQYNQNLLTDRFRVVQTDSITHSVKFAQYHNWYWKDGIGFRSFETEHCKVSESKGNILFTDLMPDKEKIFLVPDGIEWNVVR